MKFFHGEERDFVFAKSSYIHQCTGIRMEEDFPEEIEKKRRVLKPIVNKANSIVVNGKRKYQASLHIDKLKVNGKTYSTDTTCKLPEDIHPTVVYTPTNNGITAFFSGQSPFSNHHLAPQTVNYTVFNCNVQFYMFEKANTFKDYETAA